MTLRFAIALICVLALTSCAPATKRDAYTSISGETMVFKTDRGLCMDSCNQEFARCMDQRGAEDNSGVHGPRGMFGASADCRSDLKSCLDSCRTR
ncbi:MAG: hypothetical protein WAO98_03240 [Alphaproteobacteria bacterium]